ncbi:hypothetical protein D3C72_2299460 [compost metagenome]
MLVGALVPCSPKLSPHTPIQRGPSGFLGPGGTEVSTGRPAAAISSWIDLGTNHVGLVALLTTRVRPSGILESAVETATGYSRTSWPPDTR